MKNSIFTILLILFCHTNLSAQVITKEDYTIYAIVMKNIYAENAKIFSNKNTEFIILEKTSTVDFEEIDLSSVKRINGLIKNFKRKNKLVESLERQFPTSYKYNFISEKEIDKLFEIAKVRKIKIERENEKSNGHIIFPSGFFWQPFYEKYPDANGYYSFSQIGFSPNKEFSLVNVTKEDSLIGFKRSYLLKKTRGKWKILTFFGSESIT